MNTKLSFKMMLSLCLCLLLAACGTLQMMKNLASCGFRLENVGSINALGIDFTGKRSFNDFGLLDVAKVTKSLVDNQLLLNFTANVQVKNPNEQPAGMQKFDWILLVDSKEVLTGTLNQAVRIEPNQTATVALPLSIDLKKLFANQDREQTFSLAFNLAEKGADSDRIQIKIRPYLNIGSVQIPSPYLTLSKNF